MDGLNNDKQYKINRIYGYGMIKPECHATMIIPKTTFKNKLIADLEYFIDILKLAIPLWIWTMSMYYLLHQ